MTVYLYHVDMPSGPDMSGYYGRDEERAGLRVIRDTDTMNATYDRYLRSVVCSLNPRL